MGNTHWIGYLHETVHHRRGAQVAQVHSHRDKGSDDSPDSDIDPLSDRDTSGIYYSHNLKHPKKGSQTAATHEKKSNRTKYTQDRSHEQGTNNKLVPRR